MDLEAANSTSDRRQTLTTLATLFCFGLACALMIGSLMMPGKPQHADRPDQPLSWNLSTRVS